MDLSVDAFNSYLHRFTQWAKHVQFNTKMQLAFLEDLYLLINDGIPANRAVDMMSQVTTGLTHEVALSLSEKIAEGQPLAEGMREWFSVNVVEIVRVGESGGALAQTMQSAINMLRQKGVAISAFVGAVAYPALVIVMACVVILYLKRVVFTQFAQIKPMAMWPAAGQRLVEVANLIQAWWWAVILVLIGIVLGFRWLITNYTGEFRATLDRFPPFSFYRRLAAARMLETLGLLVANGVVFKSAIKVMQYQANPYLLSHLGMMEHLLAMGKTNIADVLETGLVDESDLMRLRVMAEVKGFEHGLIRMGIRGTEQATGTMKFIARVVGGLLMILGGLMIIMIVQGIYMTGMSLGQ